MLNARLAHVSSSSRRSSPRSSPFQTGQHSGSPFRVSFSVNEMGETSNPRSSAGFSFFNTTPDPSSTHVRISNRFSPLDDDPGTKWVSQPRCGHGTRGNQGSDLNNSDPNQTQEPDIPHPDDPEALFKHILSELIGLSDCEADIVIEEFGIKLG